MQAELRSGGVSICRSYGPTRFVAKVGYREVFFTPHGASAYVRRSYFSDRLILILSWKIRSFARARLAALAGAYVLRLVKQFWLVYASWWTNDRKRFGKDVSFGGFPQQSPSSALELDHQSIAPVVKGRVCLWLNCVRSIICGTWVQKKTAERIHCGAKLSVYRHAYNQIRKNPSRDWKMFHVKITGKRRKVHHYPAWRSWKPPSCGISKTSQSSKVKYAKKALYSLSLQLEDHRSSA